MTKYHNCFFFISLWLAAFQKTWSRGRSSSYINSRQSVGPLAIGICCFPAKHAALRRKSKYWSARTQINVPKLSDIVSVSKHYANPTKSVGRVQSGHHHVNECNVFSPWYSWKQNTYLAFNNNHPLTDSAYYKLFVFFNLILMYHHHRDWIMVGFISDTIGVHQYYNCIS